MLLAEYVSLVNVVNHEVGSNSTLLADIGSMGVPSDRSAVDNALGFEWSSCASTICLGGP